MSRPRKKMNEIRRILKAKLSEPQTSIRQIARLTGSSRPTVTQYLNVLQANPLTLSELEDMNDKELGERLGFSKQEIQETKTNRALHQWLDKNINRLNEKYMTRVLLHEIYCNEVKEPLKYTQFCFILQRKIKEPLSSGMFEHKAGDKMYLDFTGGKFKWFLEDGTEQKDEIFLAVWGASSRFFALPVPNQKQENFTYATQEAFLYFGGAPHAVVPDCLKSAVIQNDGHEHTDNVLFRKLLDHYGVVNIPARPNRPKDKAVVESTVNIVYRNLFAKLSNRKYENRQAMLKDWMQELLKANEKKFQKLPGNRISRFNEIDRPAMKALPLKKFDISNLLTQKVKTSQTVYVPIDKTYYSVPYSAKGKQVEVFIKPGLIEIWSEHECVATHRRKPQAGKVMHTEHFSNAQRWYAERNTQEILRELSNYGLNIKRFAQHLNDISSHEDLAFKVLSGLLSLACKHKDRIDMACRLAYAKELFTLKAVKNILKNEEDLIEKRTEELSFELPFHENIRGAAYYAREV